MEKKRKLIIVKNNLIIQFSNQTHQFKLILFFVVNINASNK